LDNFETSNHTNFSLSSDGEQIGFFAPDTTIIDTLTYNFQATDISYGTVLENQLEWNYFLESTPGFSNSTNGFIGFADDVLFSLESHFYTSSQILELSTNSGTAEIRYTIDGSFPNENSILYSSPIQINETSVIKAKSFDFDLFSGKEITNTYIIGETSAPNLDCTISLSSDPGNFFDADSGIYINYEEDWEIPVNMEIFEENNTRSLDQLVGIKIKGGASRGLPQKSFGIYARNQYGEGKINYRFFDDKHHNIYNNIVLRNSGQDNQFTIFRDALFQNIVKDNMDVDYQEYRPSSIYINGEYWGILNLREKINEHYIKRNYPNVDINNIDVLEITAFDDDEVSVVLGDLNEYNELVSYMDQNDMNLNSTYNFVKERVDIVEFSNHYITNIYIGNKDWPHNNIKWWRERSEMGKWRWIFFDLDYGFGLYNSVYFNSLYRATMPNIGGNTSATFMLRKLLENDDFKNDFVQRFSTHMNTTFNPVRVNDMVNDMSENISTEMEKQIERWVDEDGIESMEQWTNNIEVIKSYANERPEVMREHLGTKFELEHSNLTINTSGNGSGKVIIHSVDIYEFPFIGVYFKGTPFIIKAEANYGSRFVAWEYGSVSTNNSLSLNLISDSTITAVFEEVFTGSNEVVINEINYKSNPDYNSEDWIEIYNNSDEYIEISSWSLKDNNYSPSYTFPASTLFAPKSYIVICKDSILFSEQFPNISNFLPDLSFGLNSAGEKIRLYNANGDIVDSLIYDNDPPWPIEPNGEGPTLELINPSFDNILPENWTSSINHGTPGEVNSAFVSIDEEDSYNLRLLNYELKQNYPNPFNPITKIDYTSAPLSVNQILEIVVYNSIGQEVWSSGNLPYIINPSSLVFNGSNLNSGIYYYSLIVDGKQLSTKKMLMLK